jgi:hypothetical protein
LVIGESGAHISYHSLFQTGIETGVKTMTMNTRQTHLDKCQSDAEILNEMDQYVSIDSVYPDTPEYIAERKLEDNFEIMVDNHETDVIMRWQYPELL